jgi:hypothetical protein
MSQPLKNNPKRRGPKPWLRKALRELALKMIWQQAGTTQHEITLAGRESLAPSCSYQVVRAVLRQLVEDGEIIQTESDDRRSPAFMQGY